MQSGALGEGPTTLDDEAFLRLTIKRAEAEILSRTGNQREAMMAFDVRGVEFLTKVGDATEITFTRDELQLLKGQTHLVVHNHDDGTPPSAEDLAFVAIVAPVELVAFGTHVRWRLLRGPEWPATYRLLHAFNRVDRLVTRELLRRRHSNRFWGDPYDWPVRSVHVWDKLGREFPNWFTLLREER